MKLLAKLIFKLSRWKLVAPPPDNLTKCVMIAAPHTSNWDILYARSAFELMGLPVKFTIKKEWFRFPMNLLIGPLGGLPIDRSPKVTGEERMSMTDAMIQLFDKHEKLVVLVTPEGTRKFSPKWKTGFYYVAKGAGVPIACGFLDYKQKHAGVGLVIHPSDNMEADMKKIMEFYKDIPGKYPQQFTIDSQYL